MAPRPEYNSLPDGYKSAMAWGADLVRRLVEAFPDLDNPLEARGVVLVDEIDLHLHPSWQRTIVDKLRQLFPNIQFIVATHSPFIVQDMTKNDKVITLQWEGDKVVAREDAGYFMVYRVDQILTSPVFNLATARGNELEQLQFDQHSLLMRRGLEDGLPPEDETKLRDITERILALSSPPDDRIRANGNGTGKSPQNKTTAARRRTPRP